MPHHPAHQQEPAAKVPAPQPPAAPRLAIAPGQTIVFFGDSITAAQPGYIEVIAQTLRHTRGDAPLRLINAGISGNTVRDLQARADRDVIAVHPEWVSICIGTNDFLNEAAGRPEGVPLPEFEARYSALLGSLRAAGCGLVLMNIPLVAGTYGEITIPDPQPYNAAISALATREALPLVDVHRAFVEVYERAANYKQQVQLTTDGVHPNRQGHTLMARAFVSQLGLLQK